MVENTVLPQENEQKGVSLIYDTVWNIYVAPPEDEATMPVNQPDLWVQVGTAFLYAYPLIALLISIYGVISYIYFIAKLRRCPKIALPAELYILEEVTYSRRL